MLRKTMWWFSRTKLECQSRRKTLKFSQSADVHSRNGLLGLGPAALLLRRGYPSPVATSQKGKVPKREAARPVRGLWVAARPFSLRVLQDAAESPPRCLPGRCRVTKASPPPTQPLPPPRGGSAGALGGQEQGFSTKNLVDNSKLLEGKCKLLDASVAAKNFGVKGLKSGNIS